MKKIDFSIMKKVFSGNSVLVLLVIIIVLVFGAIDPQFIRAANLIQYLTSGVALGFLTFGLSATVITGNFDYSIGSMTSFGTVMMALLMSNGVAMIAALIITFLLLLMIGAVNGVVVGYLKIPGMLGTLGTSSVIYGTSLVLTKGQAIAADNEAYLFFGKSDLGTLPFGLIFLFVVFVASMIFMHKTKTGRSIYLVGSSPKAAKFTGISYFKMVLTAHLYSAAMCFCGAVVLGSKMASGRADVADTYILQAVTAAVFGGISIKGGKGSIGGALLGVIIFTLLTSGFTMINVSQFYRQVATGILLLIILFIRNFRIIFAKS